MRGEKRPCCVRLLSAWLLWEINCHKTMGMQQRQKRCRFLLALSHSSRLRECASRADVAVLFLIWVFAVMKHFIARGGPSRSGQFAFVFGRLSKAMVQRDALEFNQTAPMESSVTDFEFNLEVWDVGLRVRFVWGVSQCCVITMAMHRNTLRN